MKNFNQFTTADFLRQAYLNAYEYSDDPSTQCGAVFVPMGPHGPDDSRVCYGANHFPRGLEVTEARLTDRAVKLKHIEHAERDAIYKAALRGVATFRGTLYAPWFACVSCTRAIISAGITEVIGHQQAMDKTPDRWMADILEGNAMFDEAGVKRTYYDGKLFENNEIQVLFNGELWTP